MSGGFVPYSLRQNKAIDRAVFIDLLMRVSRSTEVHIQDYTYVGFAGPYSEDFKQVHSALGIRSMVSIEEDQHVHKRQTWNSPINCINYLNKRSSDFIDEFQPTTPLVAWLDFAAPSETASQLNQVEMLVSKMAPFDLLKVTLNANCRTLLGNQQGLGEAARIERSIDTARSRVADYIPTGIQITADDVDAKGYPVLLLAAAEAAVKAGVQGKPGHYFQLLTTFVYADSEHQMLTLSGIVLPEKLNRKKFLKQTKIGSWELSTTDWGTQGTIPIRIATPEMSVRERLYLDQRLPKKPPSALARSLGFRLVQGGEAKTKEALESYKRFYRHLPYFSRVLV